MKTSSWKRSVVLAKVRKAAVILAVTSVTLPAAWADGGTPVTIFTPGAVPSVIGSTSAGLFGLKGSNLGSTTVVNVDLGRFDQTGTFTLIGSWPTLAPDQTLELIGTVVGPGYVAPASVVRNEARIDFGRLHFNSFIEGTGPTAPPVQFPAPLWRACPGQLDASGVPHFNAKLIPPATTVTETSGPLLTNGSLTITVLNPFAKAQSYIAFVNNDSGVTVATQTATVDSGHFGVFQFSGLPADVVPFVSGAGIANVFVGNDPHPTNLVIDESQPVEPDICTCGCDCPVESSLLFFAKCFTPND